MRRSLAKKAVASLYSAAAAHVYEPVVVKGGFRLLGGHLGKLVREQGRSAVSAAAGGPILDMPVGTAHFTLELAARHHALVIGADIASGMVREAAAAAAEENARNIVVVQADAHHLPFGTGSFPAVLCTNGLQVIPGMVPAVLELARVLAPGGALYVSMLSLGVGRLLQPVKAARLPTFLRSHRDVVTALQAAGLQVTDVRTERLAALIEARKP